MGRRAQCPPSIRRMQVSRARLSRIAPAELAAVDGSLSSTTNARCIHLLTSSAVYISRLNHTHPPQLSPALLYRHPPPLLTAVSMFSLTLSGLGSSGSGVVTPVAELVDPMMREAHVQQGSLSAAPNMASSGAAGALSTVTPACVPQLASR